MGVTLIIGFDNEVSSFYPGEILSGQVTLKNDSDVKIKGLTVTFYGEADVLWTETEEITDNVTLQSQIYSQQGSRSRATRSLDKEFRNHQTFLYHEIVLMGQGESEGGTEIMLNPGTEKYRFQFRLPRKDLPSTFTNFQYGSIRYFAEARLKRPLFRYDRTEKEFCVSGALDIINIPNAYQPVGSEERIDFGWICCSEGYMLMDLQLKKKWYAPGEQINFTVTVTNSSTTARNYKIFVALTQYFRRAILYFTKNVQFNTFDRNKKISSDSQALVNQMCIQPGNVTRYNDVIAISNTWPPSTLSDRDIIRLHYTITATVMTSGKICRAVCPVVIGTLLCDLHPVLKTSSEIINAIGEIDSSEPNAHKIKNVERNLENKEYNPALNPFLNMETDGQIIADNNNM